MHILKGSHVAKPPSYRKCSIWRYSSDLYQTAHSFYCLCTKDVYHHGCYLWTQNLGIYLLQLQLLSPLSSSHLLSHLPSATLYWHVFVRSSFPFPWHLTMEVVAVFFFALPLFLLSLETKKNLFIFLCTRHAIYSVPSTECGSVFEAVLICEETETWLDTAIYLIYFVVVWDTSVSRTYFTFIITQTPLLQYKCCPYFSHYSLYLFRNL